MPRPTTDQVQALATFIADYLGPKVLIRPEPADPTAPGPAPRWWIEIRHTELAIWVIALMSEIPGHAEMRSVRAVVVQNSDHPVFDDYLFQVVRIDGEEAEFLPGDHDTAEAAITAALDYVTAPMWRPEAQHAHDPFAV
ncbi:hypothetical protein [Amycolatopsis sp. NPDC058986]|uniref:hypothetical protein n=1 Tax=unclassified Amycolatopsis TaxID=2618356 RepID=UPI0036703910